MKKYELFAPTTGATINALDNTEVLSLNPAGTLATLTIGFPMQPVDMQEFAINSTQIVTALTAQVQTNSLQTILGAPSALAVGVGWRWVYQAPKMTWILA